MDEPDGPTTEAYPWAQFYCDWLGTSSGALDAPALFGVRYVPPKRVRIQPRPDLLLAVDFGIDEWPWVVGRTLALDGDVQRRRTWTEGRPFDW